MSKTQALICALCWTVAALGFGIALLFRGFSALGILTAVTCLLSMMNAVLNWSIYLKKRKEAANEEKEGS